MDNNELKENRDLLKSIEAILFMSTEPITVTKMSSILNITSTKTVSNYITMLMEDYNKRDSSLRIIKDEDKYFMTIHDKFIPLTIKLKTTTELSKNEMKTLAYISKREGKTGIMQSQVIGALGVSAYDHIHKLIEMKFLNSKKSGRSKLISTTQKFRDYFKVGDL
jgi:segregation and condensation protein B